MLGNLFEEVLKLFLIGVAVLYVGMVMITLSNEGAQKAPINWHDPARAETLLVWAGVQIARRILRVLKTSLYLLEEASAELGERILHHR